jgi:hypothetical protein
LSKKCDIEREGDEKNRVIKLGHCGFSIRDNQRQRAVLVPPHSTQAGAENTKLKKLLAEAMLDNAILKEIAAKKWSRPCGMSY